MAPLRLLSSCTTFKKVRTEEKGGANTAMRVARASDRVSLLDIFPRSRTVVVKLLVCGIPKVAMLLMMMSVYL